MLAKQATHKFYDTPFSQLKIWRRMDDDNSLEKDKLLNKLLFLINALSSVLKNTGLLKQPGKQANLYNDRIYNSLIIADCP